MFEKATRIGLRFESVRGNLTVEDLWDLPLTTKAPSYLSLDAIAKTVNKKLKAEEEESFVETKVNTKKKTLELAMKIVKHIIETRIKENKDSIDRKSKIERRKKIMGLIEDKEDEKLKSLSKEDLLKLLND